MMAQVFVLMFAVFTALLPSSHQGSCGGHLIAKDSGDAFKSLSYSIDYSTRCTWTITSGAANGQVTLDIPNLTLDYSGNCTLGNNLTVHDGQFLVKKWCGSVTATSIASVGNSLTVVFEKGRYSGSEGFTILYYQTKIPSTCGGRLFADWKKSYFTGLVYSKNYSDNDVCTWTIERQDSDAFLEVETIFSELEADRYCRHDSVTVHDDYKNQTLLGTFCGSSTPTFKGSGRSMRVVFRSDNYTARKRFRMMYKQISVVECGNTLNATDLPAFVKTPYYPDGYLWALNCTWTINAENYGSTVNVEVDLNFEESTCRDKLSFYEGTSHEHLRTICQSTRTKITANNTMTIVFTTERSRIGGGVMLKVYQSDNYVITPTTTVSQPTRECSAFFTANVHDRFIYSSTYQRFRRNFHCKWIIKTSTSTNRVVVDHFSSTNQIPGKCTSDNVTVYDGSGPYSTLLGKWCGIGYPTFKSSNQYLTIVFNASSFPHSGFRLSYRETSEKLETRNVTLTAGRLQRVLSSPGYPKWFESNVDYYWLIVADHPSFNIEVSLRDVNLGGRSNYMEIYDGRDASATRLGRFCRWKPAFTSSSSAMFIRFHSEWRKRGRGFSLVYKQVSKNLCMKEPVKLTATLDINSFYLLNDSPHLYRYQAACYTWRITADYGSVVTIRTFHAYSAINEDISCMYNYITVFDVYHPGRNSFGKWCGGHTMYYTGHTREMDIEYVTTDNTFAGLAIKYWSQYTDPVKVCIPEDECCIQPCRKRYAHVKVGAIVGGVLASLAAVAVFAILGICFWKNRRHTNKQEPTTPSDKEKIALGDTSRSVFLEGEENLAMQKKLEQAYVPPSYKDVTSTGIQGIVLMAPPLYPSNVDKTPTTEESTNLLYPECSTAPSHLSSGPEIGRSADI